MDERGRIDEARTAFAAALERGDAEAAGAMYADRAKLLAPAAELIEGRASIEAFWQAGIDVGVSEAEYLPLEIRSRNGLAYEVGRYAFRVRGDRGPLIDRGTYLVVHERQADGSWRRAIEMFNADARASTP